MLIALYLLPCALHPSVIRQTRTGDIRGGFFGEDRETALLLMKVQLPSVPREYRASVFDIVTVEGEGCSDAGREEMSRGDTERKTDGISGDDRDFAGFPRGFRLVYINSVLYSYSIYYCIHCSEILSGS